MIYCASELMEVLHVFWIIVQSIRTRVSMVQVLVYKHDKPLRMLEKHSNNS